MAERGLILMDDDEPAPAAEREYPFALEPLAPEDVTVQLQQWLWAKLAGNQWLFDDITRENPTAMFDAMADGTGQIFFIKGEDDPVGAVWLFNIRPGWAANIQIAIWGNRREMVRTLGSLKKQKTAVLRWIFKLYKLDVMRATVVDRNADSRHMVERLGFQCDGMTRRGSKIAGRYYTLLHYSLLREEAHRGSR